MAVRKSRKRSGFVIYSYLKTVHSQQLKGMQSSYLETWKAFLSKMVHKGVRGWTSRRDSAYKTLLSKPSPPGALPPLPPSLPSFLSLSLSTHPQTFFNFFFVVSLQNWLAFESIHRPLFSEHNDVNFQNRNVPSKRNNFAFCKVCNKFIPVANRTNGDKFGEKKTKNPVQRPCQSFLQNSSWRLEQLNVISFSVIMFWIDKKERE